MGEHIALSHSLGVTGTWRDTLFVWIGTITDDNDDGEGHSIKLLNYSWKGKWVGCHSSESDNPTAEERKNSRNTFTVKGITKKSDYSDSKGEIVLSSTEYLLDNGDGLETHYDPSYDISWYVNDDGGDGDDDDGFKIVTAAGENEYGSFISAGSWRGDELILARRYVQDGDCRSFMNSEDVLEVIRARGTKGTNGEGEGEGDGGGEGGGERSRGSSNMMPWLNEICCCNFMKATKDQKEKHKERKGRLLKKRRKM